MSNPYGDDVGAAGHVPGTTADDQERAMELMGITPTTFSNNIQFQVPRFLQDGFGPALLHPADSSVPTASYPVPDFAGTSSGYFTEPSSGPYTNFPFPTFPQMPMQAASYPLTGVEGTPYTAHPSQPQKPPRSSALALNGLPIYSASGFDMLDILARVATRPQPKIHLGPVDMTCAFLVVDVTREDSPIIYVSRTFEELTGYSETEILGQNCRFLQAPPGVKLEKGGPRDHTDMDSVTHMAQNCAHNRECQVTLVNYKKSGEAFINCVSIVPIVPGGNEPVRYQVGFQVDLAVQPLEILRSVQNGSYVTNYSSTPLPPIVYQPAKLNNRALSKDMTDLMNKITPTTPSPGNDSDRQKLSLALLEECPDAIFVVSLKGSFLYVSPSVVRLLQYDADYFLNKSLADICHPSDLAPTMRNVKESTTNATNNPPSMSAANSQDIELLFRARRADNTYIWLDCPGKLYSDTSRGRKALLLRSREIEMPRMVWNTINASGGVSKDDCYLRVARDDRGLIVACLKGVEDVLGRKSDETVGKTLAELIVDDAEGSNGEAIKTGLRVGDAACGELSDSKAPRVVFCDMQVSIAGKGNVGARTGNLTEDAPNTITTATEMTFFPPLSMKPCSAEESDESERDETASWRMKPQTLVVRIRVLQRQGMGRDSTTMTRADPYESSLPGPSTGFYGSELPFAPVPPPSLQQIHAELPLPVGRHVGHTQGFQVQLAGNVNVVEDLALISERPHNTDAGGTSSSSVPVAETSTASSSSNVAGTVMAGSSWQYELQQLRMKNEKLRAELTAVKKGRRMKQKEENARLAKFESHGSSSSRQVAAPMAWSDAFMTPTPASAGGGMVGPSHSISFPMPPQQQPSSSHYDTSNNKRTWSQTDMHSEWDQWGH